MDGNGGACRFYCRNKSFQTQTIIQSNITQLFCLCVCVLFLCLFVVLPSMNFDVIDVGLSIQIPFL